MNGGMECYWRQWHIRYINKYFICMWFSWNYFLFFFFCSWLKWCQHILTVEDLLSSSFLRPDYCNILLLIDRKNQSIWRNINLFIFLTYIFSKVFQKLIGHMGHSFYRSTNWTNNSKFSPILKLFVVNWRSQ